MIAVRYFFSFLLLGFVYFGAPLCFLARWLFLLSLPDTALFFNNERRCGMVLCCGIYPSSVVWLLGCFFGAPSLEIWSELQCGTFFLRVLDLVYLGAPLCFSCQMAFPSSAARGLPLPLRQREMWNGFVLRYLPLLFLVLGFLFGAVFSAVDWLLGCFSGAVTGEIWNDCSAVFFISSCLVYLGAPLCFFCQMAIPSSASRCPPLPLRQ